MDSTKKTDSEETKSYVTNEEANKKDEKKSEENKEVIYKDTCCGSCGG